MRHLGRLKTEPSLWLVMLVAAGAAAALLYMVLTSITY
jgi:hypothetical protein